MHTSLNLVSSYYVVTPTSSFASVGVTEFVFSGDHKSFQRLSTPITSRLVNIRVRAIMWRRAWGDFLQKAFIRKPQSAFAEEDSREQLHRDLELFDLLCVGVGGTLGSGVFVLTGLIAREHAGPGVIYSWLIAGLCTALSSLSYAELSSRIPSSGSAYAYAYCTLGELPAFCAAWFLTLEYGMSGAAIARSWGDKFSFWLLTSGFSVPGAKEIHNIHELYSINVYAGLMQLVCMIILLAGVRIGKLVVNGFTVLKIALVVFMIIVGLSNFDQHNVEDMTPMGMSGVLRGSSAAFFGLLGYDEVCILAAETKDPLRNLPRAVFGTIFLTTVFSVAASLALVGMQPWPAIDADNGFASAFQSLDMSFAQRVVSTGEVVTLPLVVLVSFLAQPRLQYVMSVDGLLPDVFSRVDSQGNLTMGILISGFILTAVAILVPFSYLDDMISAGVLLSFNITNSSLIAIRRSDDSGFCHLLLLIFNFLTMILSYAASKFFASSDAPPVYFLVPVIALLLMTCVIVAVVLDRHCPDREDPERIHQYRVPLVPYLPCSAILFNSLLIGQLSATGVYSIFGYVVVVVLLYLLFVRRNSGSGSWSRLANNHDSYTFLSDGNFELEW